MNPRTVTRDIASDRALEHLLDLLRVEGLSGEEGAVAAIVARKLRAAGCAARWLAHDAAARRIGQGFSVGNLIVKVPGRRWRGARRLFVAHLDTVPLCRGAVPVLRGNRIVARGPTALGADNRTAVACLVTVLETILRHDLPHPPLTFLFTVGEEVGLLGSKHVRVADLGRPRLGFNIDSGRPQRIVVGAIGAERWEVDIFGRAAHAGVHPEQGVSAVLVAARALAEVDRRGFFGEVVKGRNRGASNAVIREAGAATNQVVDYARVDGECRSHDHEFLASITAAFRTAFGDAAAAVRNRANRPARARFRVVGRYPAFALPAEAPPVLAACAAARALGLRPELVRVNGGLDASRLSAKGIPTVTLGAGQHGAHTTGEYVDVREYLTGCRLALALATALRQ